MDELETKSAEQGAAAAVEAVEVGVAVAVVAVGVGEEKGEGVEAAAGTSPHWMWSVFGHHLSQKPGQGRFPHSLDAGGASQERLGVRECFWVPVGTLTRQVRASVGRGQGTGLEPQVQSERFLVQAELDVSL